MDRESRIFHRIEDAKFEYHVVTFAEMYIYRACSGCTNECTEDEVSTIKVKKQAYAYNLCCLADTKLINDFVCIV
jgi:hypothetical protein